MKKRAEDLRRGDVITNLYGAHMMRCPAVVINDYECGSVRLSDAAGGLGTIMIGYAQDVEVESPTLTPAQQHAEEMLELLRRVLARVEDPRKLIPQQIRELLDRIEPPAPPTAEELAEALAALRGTAQPLFNVEKHVIDAADAVLQRARATGVLK